MCAHLLKDMQPTREALLRKIDSLPFLQPSAPNSSSTESGALWTVWTRSMLECWLAWCCAGDRFYEFVRSTVLTHPDNAVLWHPSRTYSFGNRPVPSSSMVPELWGRDTVIPLMAEHPEFAYFPHFGQPWVPNCHLLPKKSFSNDGNPPSHLFLVIFRLHASFCFK